MLPALPNLSEAVDISTYGRPTKYMANALREFVSEMWRRNDMIRFGKFEDKWGFKTDADVNKRIFPIPNSALLLNPALKQNPGY